MAGSAFGLVRYRSRRNRAPLARLYALRIPLAPVFFGDTADAALATFLALICDLYVAYLHTNISAPSITGLRFLTPRRFGVTDFTEFSILATLSYVWRSARRGRPTIPPAPKVARQRIGRAVVVVGDFA